jgi:hypothetical protein
MFGCRFYKQICTFVIKCHDVVFIHHSKTVTADGQGMPGLWLYRYLALFWMLKKRTAD